MVHRECSHSPQLCHASWPWCQCQPGLAAPKGCAGLAKIQNSSSHHPAEKMSTNTEPPSPSPQQGSVTEADGLGAEVQFLPSSRTSLNTMDLLAAPSNRCSPACARSSATCKGREKLSGWCRDWDKAVISCKQEGKLSMPVLHSRMGSEGPSSVTGRERDQKMICAKPVINPAEPADGRQHLKYPIFRTHVMSRTMLDCPRTSQQCGLLADNCYQMQNQGPHSIPGGGEKCNPCCGTVAVPLGCAQLHWNHTHGDPWLAIHPLHSHRNWGQGSQRDVFLPDVNDWSVSLYTLQWLPRMFWIFCPPSVKNFRDLGTKRS